MNKKVIITTAIGRKFESFFYKNAYNSWKRYAQKYDYDIIVFNEALDKRSLQKGRHLGWEKLNVMTHDRVLAYDYAVWLDTDIWIKDGAPDICKENPVEYFGAANPFLYPSYQENQLALKVAETIWKSAGRKYTVHMNAEDFYKMQGVETEINDLIQSGVIVFSPTKIHDCVRNCYETWADDPKSLAGEMQWLSAALLEAFPCEWIDYKYNADWIKYQCLNAPDLFKEEELNKTERPKLDKLLYKWQKTKALVGLPYHKKNVLKHYINENYFLHFCGDSRDIWFVTNRLDK